MVTLRETSHRDGARAKFLWLQNCFNAKFLYGGRPEISVAILCVGALNCTSVECRRIENTSNLPNRKKKTSLLREWDFTTIQMLLLWDSSSIRPGLFNLLFMPRSVYVLGIAGKAFISHS